MSSYRESGSIVAATILVWGALLAVPAEAGVTVPGAHIVVLKPGADVDGAVARARARGAGVHRVYRHAIRGFAAELTAAGVAAAVSDPDVDHVAADGPAYLAADQPNPPWGLDRIDERWLPLDANYHYEATGAGVTAYVVDTGIRYSHTDFGGRAVPGFDAVTAGGGADDCNGHGTHVAGIVGGSTYGVAKEVELVGVRVFACTGSSSWSTVIAGIDWVAGDHQPGEPAVANISITGRANPVADAAVAALVADGVSVAVAAGNAGADACAASPARVPVAMTVAASDGSDVAASFSNWGACVDWYAPGVDVPSDWHTSDTATHTLDGTSQAAPHTAGAAAQLLQIAPAATPAMVEAAIAAVLTRAVVTGVPLRIRGDLLYARWPVLV